MKPTLFTVKMQKWWILLLMMIIILLMKIHSKIFTLSWKSSKMFKKWKSSYFPRFFMFFCDRLIFLGKLRQQCCVNIQFDFSWKVKIYHLSPNNCSFLIFSKRMNRILTFSRESFETSLWIFVVVSQDSHFVRKVAKIMQINQNFFQL